LSSTFIDFVIVCRRKTNLPKQLCRIYKKSQVTELKLYMKQLLSMIWKSWLFTSCLWVRFFAFWFI